MITRRSLLIQAAAWLGFPVVLFILFWFWWWVAGPVLALFAWALFRLFRAPGLQTSLMPGYTDVRISRSYYLIMACIFIYVAVSGIGGFVAQMPSDHAWRNAVFFDLARRDWPVMYEASDGLTPYLCYYFAFWLPAALVSKATGSIMAGDLAQLLWAFWGTWIALCFLFSQTGGKARWRILVVFIFFNAWDLFSSALFTDEYYNFFEDPLAPQFMWLSTTSGRFANSANAVFYNFIYNQAIPVWVMVCFILARRKYPGEILLWFGMLVIYAPVPSVALAPYVAFLLLRGLRRSLTVANLAGFLVAAVSALFLICNNSGGRFRVLDMDGSAMKLLLCAAAYYLISFGVFLPLIWDYIRRCLLFWSLAVMAVAGSLFGIGIGADFAWRISIPLAILICVDMCRRAADWRKTRRSMKVLFVVAMAVGAFSPVYMLCRTVVNEIEVSRGERDRKFIYLLDRLDDPAYSVYYDNFISVRPNPLLRAPSLPAETDEKVNERRQK